MYTREELEASFARMLERAKWKRRVPLALGQEDAFTNPARVSMLPIGTDGMKTITFLKNPDVHYSEMLRKLHRHAENPDTPYHFRPVRAQLKFSKSGKARTIYNYSLVDQIVLKTVHHELKNGWGKPYGMIKHPMDTAFAIYNEMIHAGKDVQILKVDISKFFPSINRDILFADLTREQGIRPAVFRLIFAANSVENTTGVVTGGSLSTLLSEFYLRDLASCLPAGIGFHRFADDMCIIIPAFFDPNEIKQQLIARLATMHLSLSAEKSKMINPMEEDFEFLGIRFQAGKPYISEDEVAHWKAKVQQDIYSEKGKLHTFKKLHAQVAQLPTAKEIQQIVWEQHLIGLRSRFHIKYAKYKRYFGDNAAS